MGAERPSVDWMLSTYVRLSCRVPSWADHESHCDSPARPARHAALRGARLLTHSFLLFTPCFCCPPLHFAPCIRNVRIRIVVFVFAHQMLHTKIAPAGVPIWPFADRSGNLGHSASFSLLLTLRSSDYAYQRHLRSEGGAECRRTHEQAVAAAKQSAPAKSSPINAFRAGNGAGPSSVSVQYSNGVNVRHDGSGSSAYDSDGTNSAGLRSAQMTPAPPPAPSLAAQ